MCGYESRAEQREGMWEWLVVSGLGRGLAKGGAGGRELGASRRTSGQVRRGFKMAADRSDGSACGSVAKDRKAQHQAQATEDASPTAVPVVLRNNARPWGRGEKLGVQQQSSACVEDGLDSRDRTRDRVTVSFWQASRIGLTAVVGPHLHQGIHPPGGHGSMGSRHGIRGRLLADFPTPPVWGGRSAEDETSR